MDNNNLNENSSEEIFQKIDKLECSDSIKTKLKVIELLKDEINNIEDNQMEKELIKVTDDYNKKFKDIENEISRIIQGQNLPEISNEVLQKYNLDKKIKPKKPKIIPNYWLTAIKNSNNFDLTKIDEDILKYLFNIELEMLEDNLSYSINFYFLKNKYFSNNKLSKTYFVNKKTKECQKTESTIIDWTGKINPNKINNKYNESFFDIFVNKQDDIMEAENNEGENFKNDLIPFSLEYYLNLMNT